MTVVVSAEHIVTITVACTPVVSDAVVEHARERGISLESAAASLILRGALCRHHDRGDGA